MMMIDCSSGGRGEVAKSGNKGKTLTPEDHRVREKTARKKAVEGIPNAE